MFRPRLDSLFHPLVDSLRMGASPTTHRLSTSSLTDPRSVTNFDRLYRDHVDLIYRFAHRLCGEPEAAKDLVQETFLNAYRGFARFRGDAQISTWLYTIASRACLRMRRRRKGAPERELSLEEFTPTSDGEFRLQIPIDGLSPEAALHNKQLRAALDAAIDQLPKKYRMVLVLRDMEGVSAKEVGAIMGLNERAVKSRLHRARLFVRRQLSARDLGEPFTDHTHASRR
jgi:RNA polymerase sigma-70 factor (ECF subfamily)